MACSICTDIEVLVDFIGGAPLEPSRRAFGRIGALKMSSDKYCGLTKNSMRDSEAARQMEVGWKFGSTHNELR